MAIRVVLSGLVGTLAGCAQLAGIDETSGDGLAGLSLSIERVSVGSTVERAPQDVTGESAAYLLPDTTRLAAQHAGIDGFSTLELREPTPILYSLPDSVLHLIDLPNPDILAAFAVLEHPGASPVAPDSLLTVTINLETPYNGEGLQLFTVGSWNQRGLEPPALTAVTVGPTQFAMSSMTSLSGRPQERITAADAVVGLRFSGNVLTGVAPFPPFDQTGNDTLAATMVGVAQDKMLDVKFDATTQFNRLLPCRPAVPSVSASWSLKAAPGAEYVNLGPQLNAAAVAMTDTMAVATYGNPFEPVVGWPSVLTFAVIGTRVFTPADTVPVTLVAGIVQIEQDPALGRILDLPAGVPELITLGGGSLSTDGITIAKPIAPVLVEFVTDRDLATAFQLVVFEVSMGTLIERFNAIGAQPAFSVPPEVFEPGKSYTLRAISHVGGFPNIAAGDIRARSLPLTSAFLDSGVFAVSP